MTVRRRGEPRVAPVTAASAATPVTAVALSPRRQAEDLARLAGEPLDVLVVGGGIVGAGAALDAVSRGLRVGIVEAQDWAAGTSSRSSKLIHGGLRYLQQYDFGLVREALRERSLLRRLAPHLVQPLAILYPIRRGLVERGYVGAGVLLYDLLARVGARGQGEAFPFHRQLSRRRALERAPALAADRLTGAIEFSDAQVDDARFALSVLRTAASHGAAAASRTLVTGLVMADGAVVGAQVRSVESGERFEVRARVVLSATGVWTERFEHLAGIRRTMRVQPSKGVHLVVPRSSIDSQRALILPTDKSVLFVLPWGAHWLVGTTDTPWRQDLARPAATSEDVDYLLATLNAVLARPVERSEVESLYVGLRPLIAGAEDETAKLSREHAVNRPMPGLVLVSGGKFTTYRVMAKDAVDAAAAELARQVPGSQVPGGQVPGSQVPESKTAHLAIVGAGDPAALRPRLASLAGALGLGPEQAERLFHRYGWLAEEVLAPAHDDRSLLGTVGETDYLRAEVAYAVTHEGARHLEDVLERRTRLSIESSDRGVKAAEEVAGLMAPLLGWDQATAASEIAGYRRRVDAELSAEQEHDDASAAARLEAVELPLALP